MAALRAAMDPLTGLHHLSEVPAPNFEVGAKVRVLEGPFAGFEGIFQKASGEERALVLLTLLSQPTSVKLSLSVLAPLPRGEEGGTERRKKSLL
jgi:transcriptional antiterminator RfaH